MSRHLLITTAVALALAATPLAAQQQETQDPLQTQPPAAADQPPTAGEQQPPAAADQPPATADQPPPATAAEQPPAAADQPPATAAEEPPVTEEPPADVAEEPAEPTETIISEQQPGQTMAKQIIGARVTNMQEENLGSVDDLLLGENDELVGAVLSVGGFLGIGAKSVAISIDQLRPAEEGTFIADLTREELENAPDFRTQEQLAAEREADAMPVEPATPPMQQ